MRFAYLMFAIPVLLIVMSAIKQSFFARWEVLRVFKEYKKKHNKEWLYAKEILDLSGFSVSQRNIYLVLDRLIKDGYVIREQPDRTSACSRVRNTYKLAL